ncbi:hypothetical protein [Lichenifustis flavocetrariae]|uniref:Uncharacterized protein n=1 Tax=Lichenifustis flavocetrariae TaxID=2949735 RepID=A0AA42CIQ5_9HYPH|nr:hypothetical protein [Lichenifustis flavocetrariae]MCW6508629.1 hypothetical protein [Lichenifustis flavocetrariae]
MKKTLGLSAAIALAIVAGSVGVANAQDASTVVVPAKKPVKGHAARSSTPMRTLTVAAPTPAPAPSPLGLITAPIGFAGSIVTAPLSGISQAFGYGPIGGASRPLPIVARYADAGAVTDSVNQGWAQPVPVSANGPVYKLEEVKNSGMVSPFAVIAAPITAATTIAAAPFNAAGAVLGAPPAPAPVF